MLGVFVELEGGVFGVLVLVVVGGFELLEKCSGSWEDLICLEGGFLCFGV